MWEKSWPGWMVCWFAPGFGHRGVEGKIVAVKYARENNLPRFRDLPGMQMAVIEFAGMCWA